MDRATSGAPCPVASASQRALFGRVSGSWKTRLTRRPGQPGTKKLLARYGERMVAVRYRYDEARNCRHKTVELIVETVPWDSRSRTPRMRDEEMVAVRIAYLETDLRDRAKRLGALWRPQQRIWEMRWLDAKNLDIADRVVRL